MALGGTIMAMSREEWDKLVDEQFKASYHNKYENYAAFFIDEPEMHDPTGKPAIDWLQLNRELSE